jgi:hypothetical protein
VPRATGSAGAHDYFQRTPVPVFDLQGRLTIVASRLASSMVFAPETDEEARGRLLVACRELTVSPGGFWPNGG